MSPSTMLRRARTGLYVPRAGGGPTAPGYSAAVLADSPLGYWRLGETSGTTMTDSSGNAHAGTYTGPIGLGATGLVPRDTDKAASFASNAAGDVPYGSWMLVNSITVEAIVTPGSTGQQAVVSRDGYSNPQTWAIYHDSGGLHGYFFDAGGTNHTVDGPVLSVGTTYHVAMTVGPTDQYLYVNGVQVGHLTYSSTTIRVSNTTTGITVGALFENGSYFWLYNGVIDEVAVYGTALSAGRISTHYGQLLGTYAVTVLADNPIAYYRLGETSGTAMNDSSSNVRTGSYVGSAGSGYVLAQASAVQTDTNTAVKFNGGYGNVAYASWMDLTSVFSYECWVQVTGGGGNGGLVGRWGAGVDAGLLWINTSSQIAFGPTLSGTGYQATWTTAPTLNTWYHVVGTVDGTNAKLYINGSLVATTPATGSMATGSAPFQIGAYASGSFYIGNTMIDEVAVYNTALTAAQVSTHYNASRVPPGGPGVSGLVAWYSAQAETTYSNGQDLTTWHDQSGNANHASAVSVSGNPKWQSTSGPSGGPAVRYDHGYFSVPNVFAGATAGEMFIRVKTDGSDCGSWGFGAAASGGDESHYPYGGTVYENWGLPSGSRPSFGPSLAITSWRTYHVASSSTVWDADLDGVSQVHSTGSFTPTFNTTPILGTGMKNLVPDMQFLGYMSCVLLFNRTLTSTERSTVMAWMAAYPSGGTP